MSGNRAKQLCKSKSVPADIRQGQLSRRCVKCCTDAHLKYHFAANNLSPSALMYDWQLSLWSWWPLGRWSLSINETLIWCDHLLILLSLFSQSIRSGLFSRWHRFKDSCAAYAVDQLKTPPAWKDETWRIIILALCKCNTRVSSGVLY